MSSSRGALALRAMVMVAVLAPMPGHYSSALVTAAQAQQAARRSVDGTVRDKDNTPLAKATVYLKDSKTLAVRSYISDEQGYYHFGQLSQNTDYEIYAEFNGKRSKSKNISSFDSKNDFSFTLKIDG